MASAEGKDGGDAEVYATVGRDITGPFFHQGTLAVLSRANGDIIVVEEGKQGGSVLANTGGQPRCVSGVPNVRQERARGRAARLALMVVLAVSPRRRLPTAVHDWCSGQDGTPRGVARG